MVILVFAIFTFFTNHAIPRFVFGAFAWTDPFFDFVLIPYTTACIPYAVYGVK